MPRSHSCNHAIMSDAKVILYKVFSLTRTGILTSPVKKTNIVMLTWNMQISILSLHFGVGGGIEKIIKQSPIVLQYILQQTGWIKRELFIARKSPFSKKSPFSVL